MKTSLLVIVACGLLSAYAQTNSVPAIEMVASPEVGYWEVTAGAAGETVNGESYFGLDVSLSHNPFSNVWMGAAQSLYWEPTLAGSTDLFVDWSQDLWSENLCLNVGWSGGALYATDGSPVWRTGPEAYLQYYVHDGGAFLYAGVNYDVYRSDDEEGGFRYGFGIGLCFP